ncbi:MAG: 16S rRNA (uracil(1498)-N(3))-methyltransferase [Thiohalomonadaceae bacterium]
MSRVPRIYHPEPLQLGATLELSNQAAQHVARVLRMGEGDALHLFDGQGGEYQAQIRSCDKRQVTVDLLRFDPRESESPLVITLAQGVSKGDRMDYTLQKAVELGVSRIVPLDTERSVVNLKGDRREKKMAHWQGVLISACEQCGRNRVPELLPWQGISNWLAKPLSGLGLLLDHRADQGIHGLPETRELILLIGPEGGLADAEREQAVLRGYQGLRLGPRVLRTETAALTAIAALQSRWGDLA